MSLPAKKRLTIATPPTVEAIDGPAPAHGLDLLPAISDLRQQESGNTAHPKESSKGARTPAAGEAVHEEQSESRPSSLQREKKFPEILMDILSNDDYASIISWLPCGQRFVIRDPDKLSSHVLPRHSRRATNFLSFRRKLNRYGFNAVRQCMTKIGPVFQHEWFRRGRPELCHRIYCQSKAAVVSSANNKAPVANSSAASECAFKPVAQSSTASGSLEAASQFSQGVPLPVMNSANNREIAPSNATTSAADFANQVLQGGLKHAVTPSSIPMSTATAATERNIATNHAVSPSYNAVSAAPPQVQLGLLLRPNNGDQSTIANSLAAAPNYNTFVAEVSTAEVPSQVLEPQANNHAMTLSQVLLPSANNHAITSLYDAPGTAAAVAAAGRIPPGVPVPLASSGERDSVFQTLLESELLMRELRRRKQRALARLLRNDHALA